MEKKVLKKIKIKISRSSNLISVAVMNNMTKTTLDRKEFVCEV